MAEGKFLLLQLPNSTHVPSEKIRPVLDKARDWVEISPNTWIVWTTSSPERWHGRIKAAFGSDIRTFISAIDPKQRHGRMPSSFWQFLNKHS